MEAFFRTHTYLVEHTHVAVRRTLMDEIDWRGRLIGIKGTRGVGKTTFLLEIAKERFDARDRRCLYINMNNFYFQGRGIHDFAGEFYAQGGRVLLIDQIFKKSEWNHELRRCYDDYPELQIIFTGSSVMRLLSDPMIGDIVACYSLRGFSFREYVNLKTDNHFHPHTLEGILQQHETIAHEVAAKVDVESLFKEYLHHGFYPFFLKHTNYSENLLKTMNMMIEVDVLLIRQIELKYLTKIKKLYYLLALETGKSPNVSKLAETIDTSRATVMNYIKYLADARLLNIIYHQGFRLPQEARHGGRQQSQPHLHGLSPQLRRPRDPQLLLHQPASQRPYGQQGASHRRLPHRRRDQRAHQRRGRGRVEGQGQKKLLHRLQRPRGRQGKENTAMALRFSLLKESLAARAPYYI